MRGRPEPLKPMNPGAQGEAGADAEVTEELSARAGGPDARALCALLPRNLVPAETHKPDYQFSFFRKESALHRVPVCWESPVGNPCGKPLGVFHQGFPSGAGNGPPALAPPFFPGFFHPKH